MKGLFGCCHTRVASTDSQSDESMQYRCDVDTSIEKCRKQLENSQLSDKNCLQNPSNNQIKQHVFTFLNNNMSDKDTLHVLVQRTIGTENNAVSHLIYQNCDIMATLYDFFSNTLYNDRCDNVSWLLCLFQSIYGFIQHKQSIEQLSHYLTVLNLDRHPSVQRNFKKIFLLVQDDEAAPWVDYLQGIAHSIIEDFTSVSWVDNKTILIAHMHYLIGWKREDLHKKFLFFCSSNCHTSNGIKQNDVPLPAFFLQNTSLQVNNLVFSSSSGNTLPPFHYFNPFSDLNCTTSSPSFPPPPYQVSSNSILSEEENSIDDENYV